MLKYLRFILNKYGFIEALKYSRLSTRICRGDYEYPDLHKLQHLLNTPLEIFPTVIFDEDGECRLYIFISVNVKDECIRRRKKFKLRFLIRRIKKLTDIYNLII